MEKCLADPAKGDYSSAERQLAAANELPDEEGSLGRNRALRGGRFTPRRESPAHIREMGIQPQDPTQVRLRESERVGWQNGEK